MTGRRAAVIQHELAGTLEAVTAFRVGGWASSPTADLVAARDGLGRLVIPGTSLAGAMRAWLGSVTGPDGRRLFDKAALGLVFGELEHKSQGGEVCRIVVDDAAAVTETGVEVRDGVGIDRVTGSAAEQVLYQHEVVRPGSKFAARITAWQTAADTERVSLAFDLLARALTEGRVEIGAARTRGLGQVRLTDARRTRADLTSRAEVLCWLSGRQQPQPRPQRAADPEPDGEAALASADGRLGIEITWKPVSPVMVRASTVNEPEPERDRAVDTVPLRTNRPGPDGGEALLLPGSSIKGVLRSHAERVVRTIRGIDDLPADWLDQVNDDQLGPVLALFGAAGGYEDRRQARSAEGPQTTLTPDAERAAAADHAVPHRQRGRRGALSVRDCLGTVGTERVVTHVAIDRWTGGAAENLLFSVQEPADASWEPITMSLDIRRAQSKEDPGGEQALALLLLVLRDLNDGWLALGFGGTRGHGSVRASQISFSGNNLPGVWSDLLGRSLAELIENPPDGVMRALAAWRAAVPA